MPTNGIQRGREGEQLLWPKFDAPLDAVRQGHTDLLDIDAQAFAVPVQLAGADGELFGTARAMGTDKSMNFVAMVHGHKIH